MRKNKWTNLFSTLLAGSTITSVVLAANHMAKKYGQKPNTNRLITINPVNLVDYAVNKFLESDENETELPSVDR